MNSLFIAPLSAVSLFPKIFFPILASFLIVPLLHCPAWAIPKEVTIFPQSARVTEVTKVHLNPAGKDLRKAVIIVPGMADPTSFAVDPPSEAKFRLEDHTWRKSPRDEDAAVKDLRKQIKQLREERNGLQASLQSLDNQIQFWQQQTKARAKTTMEAGVIAAAIGKNIKKAFQDKLNLAPEIPRLDKKIKELEEELNVRHGKDDQTWVWEVTILLSGLPAGVPPVDVLLTYSYNLTGCGWQPAYRFDARPPRAEILFGLEAEVWQNSGQPWNDVVVQLATFAAPASLIAPEVLPSWTVKPREVIKAKAKRPADKATIMPGPEKGEEAPAALSSEDLKIWPTGRKTILSGLPMKMKLSEETWPAVFGYLARPARNPQAFISALFNSPETRKIPSARAMFFYQGALIGKSSFSLSGKQGLLFFGPDPQVTVTRQLLIDRPRHRQWRLEARNDHTTPIKLRIEEGASQTPDSKLKVKMLAAGAEEKLGLLSWEIGLAPGEQKALVYDIELDASTDIESGSGSPP